MKKRSHVESEATSTDSSAVFNQKQSVVPEKTPGSRAGGPPKPKVSSSSSSKRDAEEGFSRKSSRERKEVKKIDLVAAPKRLFSIPDGKGIPLGEIDFVNHQFDDSANREILDKLHMFLFGRGKKHEIKRHLRQFRGVVYHDPSVQREKSKTKLTKWTVPELKTCSHMLGIKLGKDKEQLMEDLLDFFEKPTKLKNLSVGSKSKGGPLSRPSGRKRPMSSTPPPHKRRRTEVIDQESTNPQAEDEEVENDGGDGGDDENYNQRRGTKSRTERKVKSGKKESKINPSTASKAAPKLVSGKVSSKPRHKTEPASGSKDKDASKKMGDRQEKAGSPLDEDGRVRIKLADAIRDFLVKESDTQITWQMIKTELSTSFDGDVIKKNRNYIKQKAQEIAAEDEN